MKVSDTVIGIQLQNCTWITSNIKGYVIFETVFFIQDDSKFHIKALTGGKAHCNKQFWYKK